MKSASSALAATSFTSVAPLALQDDLGRLHDGREHARQVDVEGADALGVEGVEGVVGLAQEVGDGAAGEHVGRPSDVSSSPSWGSEPT